MYFVRGVLRFGVRADDRHREGRAGRGGPAHEVSLMLLVMISLFGSGAVGLSVRVVFRSIFFTVLPSPGRTTGLWTPCYTIQKIFVQQPLQARHPADPRDARGAGSGARQGFLRRGSRPQLLDLQGTVCERAGDGM